MRIGMVCPYSWDVPGGVQFHVRDLAEHFIAHGHEVWVLAPADDDAALPDYVTSCGRAVPVRYNGSVARLTFGPVTAGPGEPLARGRATSTCCTCTSRSPRRLAAGAVGLDRAGRRDLPHRQPPLARHAGGPPAAAARRWRRSAAGSRSPRTPGAPCSATSAATPFVIPNGVYVDRFAAAPRADPSGAATADGARPWRSSAGSTSRARACAVALGGAARGARRAPGRPGARRRPRRRRRPAQGCRPARRGRDRVLGTVTDDDKASLLRSVDVYVAPHPGRRELRHRAGRGDGAPAPPWSPPTCRPSPPCSTAAHRRPVRDRVARRRWRAPCSACSPTPTPRGRLRAAGRPGARRSTGASSPTGSWPSTRPSSRAPTAEPVDPAPQGLWGRLVRGVPGGGG